MLKNTCNALLFGSLIILSGCDNNNSSDVSPDTNNQEPIARLPDIAMPGEAVMAGENQAVIHLVDIAGITSGSAADYSTKNLFCGITIPVMPWIIRLGTGMTPVQHRQATTVMARTGCYH